MNIRPTQASNFSLVQNGMLNNFSKLVEAQAQVSSGRRFMNASDDPVGAARALTLRSRSDANMRYLDAIQGGTRELDMGAGVLQDADGLISEARAVALQAINGTTNADDRKVLAQQLRQIKSQLLDLANSKASGRYLFAGTALGGKPFGESNLHGFSRTSYNGNNDQQQLLVGTDQRLALGIPGSDIFGALEPSGTSFGDLTGAASGVSVDQGSGAATLFVRHDSTTLALASGVTRVNGGADDNLIGDHTISIDPVAGTVTLDSGPARSLPAAGSPEFSNFELTNAQGDSIHLDFSAWNGAADTGTATGAGSISLDSTNWTAIGPGSNDVELIDAATNTVLHVDATAIHRAGDELVSFGGTVNIFDALESIANTLENSSGLTAKQQESRISLVLDELDRNHDNVTAALSTLGARSERMKDLESSYGDMNTSISNQLSLIEDADYSKVVLDMMRAEQTLQLTQSVGSKLLQNSFLNFIR